MGFFDQIKDRVLDRLEDSANSDQYTDNDSASNEFEGSAENTDFDGLIADSDNFLEERKQDFLDTVSDDNEYGSAESFQIEDDEEFLDKAIFDHAPKPVENKEEIEDIYRALKLSKNARIADNVISPKTLSNPDLSLSAPTGYDRGETEGLLSKAKGSIETLLSVIKGRDEDLWKMAGFARRLQEENKKLLQQVKLGTMDLSQSNPFEADLSKAQNELILLKEENRQLRKKIDQLEKTPKPTTTETNTTGDGLTGVGTPASAEMPGLPDLDTGDGLPDLDSLTGDGGAIGNGELPDLGDLAKYLE